MIVTWLIIAVLGIAAYFIIGFKHLRYKFYAVVLILLMGFLFVSFMGVAKQNEIDYTSSEGIFDAVKIYVSWLGHGVSNMKVLVANAIKMDWTPENESEGEI